MLHPAIPFPALARLAIDPPDDDGLPGEDPDEDDEDDEDDLDDDEDL